VAGVTRNGARPPFAAALAPRIADAFDEFFLLDTGAGFL